MSGTEKVIKHLEMIQAIINRLGSHSFTDFEMDVLKHRTKPQCTWLSAVLSVTLIIFYAVEVVFILVTFAILRMEVPS